MGALEHSIQVLKVITPVLDMVPAIGGNLKGAAELASEICEMVKTIKENREGYEALGNQAVQLLAAISGELENAELSLVEEVGKRVEKLIKLLKKIQSAVSRRARTESQSDSPPPTGACDRISGWLCNTATDVIRVSADTEDIESMQKELQDVIQEFNLTAAMRTEMKIDTVKELAGRMMVRMSELQTQLDMVLRDNSKRGKRTDRDADIELLKVLEPITSAAWNAGDAVICAPSTRELILNNAIAWAGDSGNSCVFWMNGLAGTGKSTIARTLCRSLADRQLLGASFFATRQDQARRDASNIIRTIAHQLAIRERSFGDALCAQLRENPMSSSRLLEAQIADFVIKPAATLLTGQHAPLIIVIDALDECVTDTRGRPGGDFILLLVRGLLTLPGRLKVFLTSRAEPTIQRMFDQLSASGTHTAVKLHELDKSMVQADIMTFLRQSFGQIRSDMPRLNLSHWPSTYELEQLVQMSGVLFVYASTVVRYVGSRRHGPRDRLAHVLGQQQVGPVTAPYRFLDTLYMQVLEEAAGIRPRGLVDSQYELEDVNAFCQRTKAVVAVIVMAQIPLKADAVAALSGVKDEDALITMDDLSAILLIEDGEPVQIFHPSFPDFMLDPDRCEDPRLHIQRDMAHGSLAFRCLRLMNEWLSYNICELSDPDLPNAEVPDLKTRLSEHIPDALRYACCFWMVHVLESGPPGTQLRAELEIFCRKHLFHWLEVLSLLESWSSTELNALKAIEWCKKYDLQTQGTPITQLLQDVVEILQLYGIPIRSHALQIYHSAFVTMPSCVLLDTLARDSISELLPRMLSPRATHLSHAARVLMAHISPVEAVAYSPDGTYIVSGSQDRTIWVWSAVTFEQLGRMEGFRDAVNSVVFSPDGARVVAGSDDHTVRIWNVVDQALLATLKEHQDRVYSVAVSPDGARIISGSQDKTIRVWCAHSFTQLSQLQGYESRVLSVVFSPKGDLILSSCRDTIRVFDSSSLDPLVELTATLPSDPMDQGIFRCAAFSHDGAHILAGTTTGRVRVRSAVAFQELAALDQKLGSADCLSISPDGAFVLSSDWDNGHIHVWDAQSFKEIARFHAHQWGVRSVAFSPDSTRFVSGGMDKAVRVWVTDMFNENPIQSEAPSRQIRSLVFSVDGAHILLRSQDRDHKLGRLSTARVWNINTFEELGQIERVSLFLFSPDGTRAVVHENELLLGVWSLSPFEKISQLDMPDGPGRIESMSYSSEGNRILCGMPGGGIKSLSAITFEELFAFQAHSSSVLDVVFSTNDSRLISRSMADGIRVWDARTLEKLGEIPLHNTSIDCMSVSPKGMHIMAGFPDRTVRIWSTLAFHEILRLPLGRGWKVNHTAFSPDGQSILIAYHSCETQAWTCSKVDSSLWTEVPLASVQLPVDGTAGALGITLSTSGWLRCWIDSEPRLIWLPHDRQGTVFSSSGRRVAVVADTGDLTVLTFPSKG